MRFFIAKEQYNSPNRIIAAAEKRVRTGGCDRLFGFRDRRSAEQSEPGATAANNRSGFGSIHSLALALPLLSVQLPAARAETAFPVVNYGGTRLTGLKQLNQNLAPAFYVQICGRLLLPTRQPRVPFVKAHLRTFVTKAPVVA